MSHSQRIPDDAELMFSGVRSQIYQWDQKMYDWSIRRFESIRFLNGAFVLPILPDGRIILTKQEQPWRKQFISLPGGSFDSPDELPIDCAKRELREETWYESLEFIDWMVFNGTNNVYTEVYYYIARWCTLVGDIMPDWWEKIELFIVSFDELLELSSHPWFHHHWNLLPIFYEARLNPEKKIALKKLLYGM